MVLGKARSAGAVYTPAAVIVPVDRLPPGMAFTLHVTPVSVVFVTVAANVREFPSKTELLGGVTVTAMGVGGGGGGGFVPVPVLPPPQPWSHTPEARSAIGCKTARVDRANFSRPFIRFVLAAFCVRGRMHGGMQAKGQRKEEASSGPEE
jgi:hypothetical protein